MTTPGDDQKITNTDEQSVAVNVSTTDDGGYDEPVNRDSSAADENKEVSKSKDKKSAPASPRKAN